MSFVNAPAQGTTRVVALAGESSPDGNGVFGRLFSQALGRPVINASGQVAFLASLTNTMSGSDQTGVYLFDGAVLTTLVRGGEPAPPTEGNFSGFAMHSTSSGPFLTLNDAGAVGVFASVSGDPNYSSVCGAGIYRLGHGVRTALATCGAEDPRSLGIYDDFGEHGLNAHGRVAFQARVELDLFTNPVGVFWGDENEISTVLMWGDQVPGGDETFTASLLRGFNNADHALIFADDTGDAGGLANESIYLGHDTRLALIALNGQSPPEGNGVFRDFGLGALNNSNLVAFTARLQETSGGTSDDAGLYLADTNAIYLVGREGTLSPRNATWGVFRQPALNDLGQMAILVTGNTLQSGVFVATTNSVSVRVPHGAPPPDGQGALNLTQGSYPNVAINNRGQVLFQATISGGPTTARMGVFLAEPDGTLRQVARRGQELLGSTIQQIEMTSAGNAVDAGGADLGGQRPLNDAGQVTFWAELADGRDGIFLWSPPSDAPSLTQVSFDGSDIVVRFDSAIGRSYRLLRRAGFEFGEWIGEGEAVQGTGAELELRHADALGSFPQQFYQVEVFNP